MLYEQNNNFSFCYFWRVGHTANEFYSPRSQYSPPPFFPKSQLYSPWAILQLFTVIQGISNLFCPEHAEMKPEESLKCYASKHAVVPLTRLSKAMPFVISVARHGHEWWSWWWLFSIIFLQPVLFITKVQVFIFQLQTVLF